MARCWYVLVSLLVATVGVGGSLAHAAPPSCGSWAQPCCEGRCDGELRCNVATCETVDGNDDAAMLQEDLLLLSAYFADATEEASDLVKAQIAAIRARLARLEPSAEYPRLALSAARVFVEVGAHEHAQALLDGVLLHGQAHWSVPPEFASTIRCAAGICVVTDPGSHVQNLDQNHDQSVDFTGERMILEEEILLLAHLNMDSALENEDELMANVMAIRHRLASLKVLPDYPRLALAAALVFAQVDAHRHALELFDEVAVDGPSARGFPPMLAAEVAFALGNYIRGDELWWQGWAELHRDDSLAGIDHLLHAVDDAAVPAALFEARLRRANELLRDSADLERDRELVRLGTEHGLLEVAEAASIRALDQAERLQTKHRSAAERVAASGLRIEPPAKRWVYVGQDAPEGVDGESGWVEPMPDSELQRRLTELGQLQPAAETFFEIGTFHHRLGRLDRAESLYRAALELDELMYGKDALFLEVDRTALGAVAFDRQDYERAEALLTAASKKLAGANDAREFWLAALENLAVVHAAQGRYDTALSDYAELLRSGGWSQSDELRLLVNYGGALRTAGRLDEARAQFDEALRRSLTRNGELHPQTAAIRLHLATLAVAAGDHASALEGFRLQAASSEGALETMLRLGSESDKLEYVRRTWREQSAIVSLALHDTPRDIDAVELAARVVLNRKARVAEAVSRQLGDARQLGPDGAARLLELQKLRALEASLELRGRQAGDEYGDELARIRARRASLESEFARATPHVGSTVTLEAVGTALAPGAALVEYVRYRPYTASAVLQVDRWGPPHYAAFVIRPDVPIRAIALGPAAEIDAASVALRTALANRGEYVALARELDALVWEPVRSLVQVARPSEGKRGRAAEIECLPVEEGGVGRFYVSPDGALATIPFEALVDANGRHQIELFAFDYLATGRDLLRHDDDRVSSGGAVIVANPEFGAAGSVSSGVFAGVRFTPLPGTAREAKALKRTIPTATVLDGEAATKASALSVTGPPLLHVATHGFYLAERYGTSSERGLHWVHEDAPPGAAAPPENPLLRAGLAFAHANDDPASGVLTALEATALDLHGTRLVTLSACETGLGDLEDGEGVQGLRRAFTIAGAETVVTSLWKVDDQATADLMSRYYERLADGEGRLAGLRAAQIELMRAPTTRHPHYWAAFVVSGSPDGLDGVDVEIELPAAPPEVGRGCRCETSADSTILDSTVLLGLIVLLRRRRGRAGAHAR